MHKIIGPKAQKKLDTILQLKDQLKNWTSLSEDEVFEIVKEFEKKPRDEVSFWYKEALSDNDFSQVLLSIARHYQANTKLNVYVVSALGNMIERYELNASYEIFNYFIESSNRKGVAFYVSLFLPYLPQFETWPNKWPYIMSIKNIKPAKDGEKSFCSRVRYFLNQMPVQYFPEIIAFFEQAMSKAKSEHSKSMYQELIEQLKRQSTDEGR